MRKYRLCYISRNYYNQTSAGNKAKIDNEDTVKEMGAINLGILRTVKSNKLLAFSLNLLGIIRACILLQEGDILFLQYPVKKYFSFLCNVARMKGARTISLIHDLGSFRRKKLSAQKEISRLSHSEYIIASNENMKCWLLGHGLQNSVSSLGLFDYRSLSFHEQQAPPSRITHHPTVVYAGALNMRKNSFLIELTKSLNTWDLIIVGNKNSLKDLQDNPHITYRGFLPSEEFIAHIDADFGLVWEGDSLDTCSGDYGNYLRWNSPHKASFYLRAGLPVIIWKEAAVAPVIEKAEIGITINTLNELDTKLAILTPESYQKMKANTAAMAKGLNEGYFLKKALDGFLQNLS